MAILATPQSQGTVEHLNAAVQNKLYAWMVDTYCKDWANGIHIVQFTSNTIPRATTGVTSYEAIFGKRSRFGLFSTGLTDNVLINIHSEQAQQQALDQAGGRDIETEEEDDSAETLHKNQASSPPTCSGRSEEGAMEKACKHCSDAVHVTCSETTEDGDTAGCTQLQRKRARRLADKGQSAKGQKMLCQAAGELPVIHVGKNATLKILQFDRSTTDPDNVTVVAMAEEKEGILVCWTVSLV